MVNQEVSIQSMLYSVRSKEIRALAFYKKFKIFSSSFLNFELSLTYVNILVSEMRNKA